MSACMGEKIFRGLSLLLVAAVVAFAARMLWPRSLETVMRIRRAVCPPPLPPAGWRRRA